VLLGFGSSVCHNTHMNGQWIGEYTGTNSGRLLINVDCLGSGFAGVAYATPEDTALPVSGVGFQIPHKEAEFAIDTNDLWAINRDTGSPLTESEMEASRKAGIQVPSHLSLAGKWTKTRLSITWKSPLGLTGFAEIERIPHETESSLAAQATNWQDFKRIVAEGFEHSHYYRGQPHPWRLRTSFHRTGRANLLRYVQEDIVELHRLMSTKTRHNYDLENPKHRGSFLCLAQHHGYPTPLLDWSHSPYIAAFFAFREVTRERARGSNSKDSVRIYKLHDSWEKSLIQLYYLDRPSPHLSINKYQPFDNDRMVPQQSVSTVTNIDDIETYLTQRGRNTKMTYLSAFDLPAYEAPEVLRDLRMMGITPGSLFPGLDGLCEELRIQKF